MIGSCIDLIRHRIPRESLKARRRVRAPSTLGAVGGELNCTGEQAAANYSLARLGSSPYGEARPPMESPMRPNSVLLLTSLIALAACGGSPSAPSNNPPGTPRTAYRITIYTGDGQVGPKGSALPGPLCTNVFDGQGNLMANVMVTYTVTTGGGQMQDPISVPTNSNGIATSGTWTLGPAAGTQTVTASTAGVAQTVTFTATAQ